jgi:galactokinase
MESVASYFRKKVLGEVSPSRFYKKMPSLKGVFSGRAILRAKHFFDENKRVLKTKKAVETKNKKAFLRLINESGLSSYTLLQNCFPTGDVEQPIPFALAVVSADKDTLAHRVHGGGFAGTILAFVDTEKSRSYVERMKDVFGKENVFGVKIRKKGAVEIEL